MIIGSITCPDLRCQLMIFVKVLVGDLGTEVGLGTRISSFESYNGPKHFPLRPSRPSCREPVADARVGWPWLPRIYPGIVGINCPVR
jgi:hypothetical protein